MSTPLLESLLEQPDFSRKSRLPSLFSDFSPLALSNRDGYEANIKAWITALDVVHLQNPDSKHDCLCISADKNLAESLASRQWGRPLALAAIESEARNRKAWISRDHFLKQDDSIYHIPGLLEKLSIGSIARWGFSKIWTNSIPRTMSGTTYVSVANVEHVGAKVIEQMKEMLDIGYSGHITTTTLLTDAIASRTGFRLSREDMEILLRFLERDKAVISRSSDIIKFIPPTLSSSSDRAVSETDLAIAQLKSTLTQLSSQNTQLSSRIDALTLQIQQSVAKQQKKMALSAMKSRKLVDQQLDQRTSSFHNLEQILLKIDESANTVGVLKAMEGGSKALAEIMRQVGGIERVDRVLDEVQEQMAVNDEIGQVIGASGGGVGIADVDVTDEIEQEWQAMLKSERDSAAAAAASSSSSPPLVTEKTTVVEEQGLLELPDVPVHKPKSSTTDPINEMDKLMEADDGKGTESGQIIEHLVQAARATDEGQEAVAS